MKNYDYKEIEKLGKFEYHKPFLKTLERNTSKNSHAENCRLIAYSFGTPLQVTQFREIDKEHKALGYIPFFVLLARDYLVKDILNNMDNKRLSKAIERIL